MSADRADDEGDGACDADPSHAVPRSFDGDDPDGAPPGDETGGRATEPSADDAEAIAREQVATAVARLEGRYDGESTERQRDVLGELACSIVRSIAPRSRRVVRVASGSDASSSSEEPLEAERTATERTPADDGRRDRRGRPR